MREGSPIETITHPCRFCGQQVYTRSKISTAGWVCIVVGLLLSPVCIGLFIIFAGLFMKDSFVACDNCGPQ